jgi:hypothetical protein
MLTVMAIAHRAAGVIADSLGRSCMLVLLLALQQSVADSSPFRALPLPARARCAARRARPAAATGNSAPTTTLEATLDTATKHPPRQRQDLLRQSLAGDAAVRVGAARSESVRAGLGLERAEPAAAAVRRAASCSIFTGKGFSGGYHDRSTLRAAGTAAHDERLRNDDCASSWRSRSRPPGRHVRRGVALSDPTVRRRPDGPAWDHASTSSASGYPRMAVYDDVHGWNTLPFLGAGEYLPRVRRLLTSA